MGTRIGGPHVIAPDSGLRSCGALALGHDVEVNVLELEGGSVENGNIFL